jgi:lipid biosynthesis B12-binding/radical SAM protein
MSKILLISVNTEKDPYPVYPIGMAMVAGALESEGHEVTQFDMLASAGSGQKLENIIRSFNPDFIGCSLRNIDNVDSFSSEDHWYLGKTRELIGRIRGLCKAQIIVGGSAFSIMPENILSFIGADYGIVGSGARAACELIQRLEKGQPPEKLLAGATLSKEASPEIPPAFDGEMMSFYTAEGGVPGVPTKYGCVHSCNYCTYPALEGSRIRVREPEAVIADMERMHRDHDIRTVFFTDSVFNDISGHYLKLVEALARRALPMSWCAFFRPNKIDRDELKLMKRSGLYAVELGSDAATDTTLAAQGKGFLFDDVVDFHETTRAEQIPCAHYIMFGGPEESAETITTGLAQLEKLKNAVIFAFAGIRILPGTGLQQIAISEGIIKPDDPLLRPTYYFSPKVHREEMAAAIETAFNRHRSWIFPPSKSQAKMEIMRKFGYRGVLWDMLVSFPGKATSRQNKKVSSGNR